MSEEGAQFKSSLEGNVRIEYGYNKIILNDGRMLIAQDSDGEPIVKVAKEGHDVLTATPEQLMFDSELGTAAIIPNVGNQVGGWTVNEGELVGEGPALVRAGQVSFNNGIGFFLGNIGVPQFSIGDSEGDGITWDGETLRIKGNFVLSSIFNNVNYLVADLPVPPTAIGYNSPSGNEEA